MGLQHAEAIAEAGGSPVLWDIDGRAAKKQADKIQRAFKVAAKGMHVDVTNPKAVKSGFNHILDEFDRVDILINNAANDPKVKAGQDSSWSRVEHFSLHSWNEDLAVGITGAFLCSQVIGHHMAQKGGGVILNVASDLSVIAPDQRIYHRSNLPDGQQPVKPVSYSVVKHGLIGLTKYLATYWAMQKVRVNAISPGGIYDGHLEDFVIKLTHLIPMGRMAEKGEYKAAVLFLVSDASSYITGANLIIDGGRTCW